MSKFKVGDKVVKKSGTAFSNGEKVATVKETVGGIVFFDETSSHIGQTALDHYGQTLAELNVKAGDVVEIVCSGVRYKLSKDNTGLWLGDSMAIAQNNPAWRIISRASDTSKWLPCPPNYKPNDNHEVTYHMGVPTHYYVTEPVLVDGEWSVLIQDEYRIATGKTQDGKPVGKWTIDMDAD